MQRSANDLKRSIGTLPCSDALVAKEQGSLHAYASDPRPAGPVGATLTLMGVVAVNVIATLLLPGLSTDATATTKEVPPAPVRIVGAPDPKFMNTPTTDVDSVRTREGCADQTWPYIKSRCLTRTTTTAATRSAPNAPAKSSQTAPVFPKIEIDPPTPARSSTGPSDPQPLKDGPNNSVGPTPVGKAHVPDTSSYAHMPPAPSALLPRTPGEMPQALQLTDEARVATVAATTAAGLAMTRLTAEPPKVRTRSDRRRRTAHSSRSFRLFGFRVGGLRF